MTEYQVFKETVVPATLEPHSIYLIAPAGTPDYLEIVVTTADGNSTRRTLSVSDVQSMIDSSSPSGNLLEVVEDISERDALVPTLDGNVLILVLDASADTTVNAGSAMYAYRHSDTSLTKTSEGESVDVVLQWNNIQGAPSSSPASIDAAVNNSHTHANASELDKIGENVDGNLTYNGSLPKIAWASTGW